jgi:hypothetical protein
MTSSSAAIGTAGAQNVFRRTVAPGGSIYVVLDAAREPGGPQQARQAGLECQSLYTGEMGDLLKGVAPYIIEFRVRSVFRQWWFQQWGHSIGVLAEAPVSLEELRKHFRTLLMVRGEDRKRYVSARRITS